MKSIYWCCSRTPLFSIVIEFLFFKPMQMYQRQRKRELHAARWTNHMHTRILHKIVRMHIHMFCVCVLVFSDLCNCFYLSIANRSEQQKQQLIITNELLKYLTNWFAVVQWWWWCIHWCLESVAHIKRPKKKKNKNKKQKNTHLHKHSHAIHANISILECTHAQIPMPLLRYCRLCIHSHIRMDIITKAVNDDSSNSSKQQQQLKSLE